MFVSSRAGRAGVQDGAEGKAAVRQGFSGDLELFEGIAAHADEVVGL